MQRTKKLTEAPNRKKPALIGSTQFATGTKVRGSENQMLEWVTCNFSLHEFVWLPRAVIQKKDIIRAVRDPLYSAPIQAIHPAVKPRNIESAFIRVVVGQLMYFNLPSPDMSFVP